jgi:hypothetical protein
MVEVIELKLWYRDHNEWHDFPAECHKNLQICSNFMRKDRWTDRLVISEASLSLLEESRLR